MKGGWLLWSVLPWLSLACTHSRPAAPPEPKSMGERLDRLEQLQREIEAVHELEPRLTLLRARSALLQSLSASDPSDRIALEEYVSREDAPAILRGEVLYHLAEVGDRSAMALYLMALTHRDLHMRISAALCFRALRDVSCCSLLLHCLDSEKETSVRQALLDAVIALRPAVLADMLWERMRTERDPLLRGCIVAELARDPGKRSREDLLPLLDREDSEYVQLCAFGAWAKRNDDEGVRLLAQAIDWPHASPMGEIAVRELADMTCPRAYAELARLLRTARKPEDRREVLGAFIEKPIDGEIEPLVWDAAQKGQPEEVRAIAMWVLASAKREDAVRFLGAVAADPIEPLKVRDMAAFALQERGGQEALQLMRELLSPDQPDQVRCHAIVGLMQRLDFPSLRAVREYALRDPSDQVRWFSVLWLGHVGRVLGPEVVDDVLSQAERDGVEKVRHEATKSWQLAAEYSPDRLKELVKEEWPLLKDPEETATWCREQRSLALRELRK